MPDSPQAKPPSKASDERSQSVQVEKSPLTATSGPSVDRSKAQLEVDGKVLELPVHEGSMGERAVDVSKLRSETGLITFDPGFGSTGACLSEITFINGEEGILMYRGIPIQELAHSSDFTDVTYLLMEGELPEKTTLEKYRRKLSSHTALPESINEVISHMPQNAHPMAMLAAATNLLSAAYPEFSKPQLSQEEKREAAIRLVAQMPTMVAAIFKRVKGEAPVAPKEDLDYVGNFLHGMFSTKEKDYEISPAIHRAIDLLLVLHADHEQNCSTATVRDVGSSQASLFAAVAAGIDALWGPLHGGANEKVLNMLAAIEKDGGDLEKYILRAKDKRDPFRLMGFGHRVYKNFDPRATIIKAAADDVLQALGVDDPLLNLAKKLEERALNDQYFVERKLFPNVDFYSGIIYRALGIPANMFTPMFALGRNPGWISQWVEMTQDPATRIKRPRQIYTGEKTRGFTSLEER